MRNPNIRSRKIADSDLDEIAGLLSKGVGYPKHYFLQLFRRLKSLPTPTGFPKYGLVLTSDESIVGVILLIFSEIKTSGISTVRCHVTSWYVKPAYRCYATLFLSAASKNSDVTYLNTSARSATRPIIEEQGFSKYSEGQFATVPLLDFRSANFDVSTEITDANKIPNAQYDPFERELLLTHSRFGNISLWCTAGGAAHPFIFQRRFFKGILPGVQLVYCRNVKDFVRFARPIGIALASRGLFVIRIDSNGPITGLVGKFFSGMEPRYYKGPAPRLGDLTYTQTVICPHMRRPNKVMALFRGLKDALLRRVLF